MNCGSQNHFYHYEIDLLECLAKDYKLSASCEATQANLHYFFVFSSLCFCFLFYIAEIFKDDKKEKSASRKWKVFKNPRKGKDKRRFKSAIHPDDPPNVQVTSFHAFIYTCH